MKIEDIRVSMLETQDVYGPPPEPVHIVGDNPGQEPNSNNNITLIISNVFITVALLVLGIIAIVNRKLSKKIKIFLLIGIIVLGIFILYFINNKIN